LHWQSGWNSEYIVVIKWIERIRYGIECVFNIEIFIQIWFNMGIALSWIIGWEESDIGRNLVK